MTSEWFQDPRMISEWFFENQMVIGVVGTIIFTSMIIYKHVAIKYNLPLWKWIKNHDFTDWTRAAGAP